MNFLKTKKTKAIAKKFFVAAALFFVAFILSLKSGFNILAKGGNQATDGDVFRTMGYFMGRGLVPYRDVFDHKGMFIYFLNWLSNPLGKVRGIWAFEFLGIFFSVCAAYFFSRKFNSILKSFFVLLFVFARYSVCGYGNCCEEYAMFFEFASLWIFFDYYQNPNSYTENSTRKFFDVRICFLGFCFSCVFFMKANLCAMWIAFCAAIFFECIFLKKWKAAFRFAISFAAGFLIVAIPIFAYLFKNRAIKDFVFDYFVFNKNYSHRVSAKRFSDSFFYFLNTIPCIISLFILAIKIQKKDKSQKFCMTVFAWNLLLTMAGDKWPKMEAAILPCFLYPASQIFVLLEEKESEKKLSRVTLAALLVFLIVPSWANLLNRGTALFTKRKNARNYENAVVKFIKKNTNENDAILVFGNKCVFYLYGERLPASKYFFLPPAATITRKMMEEYFFDLEKTLPKVIVVCAEYKGKEKWISDKMNEFLKENGYALAMKKPEKVYMRK